MEWLPGEGHHRCVYFHTPKGDPRSLTLRHLGDCEFGKQSCLFVNATLCDCLKLLICLAVLIEFQILKFILPEPCPFSKTHLSALGRL